MSKAYEWRDAIEKAKILEQRFELSNGTVLVVSTPGVRIHFKGEAGDGWTLEVDDAELVRLGTWLYETFYEEPVEGQEP